MVVRFIGNNAYFLLTIQVLIQSNEARRFVCSSLKKFRMEFTMSCNHTNKVSFHHTCYFISVNYAQHDAHPIWMARSTLCFILLSKSWKLLSISHIFTPYSESDWLIFSLFRQIISLRVCSSECCRVRIDRFSSLHNSQHKIFSLYF